MIRTSQTHLLHIATLPMGNEGGAAGVTLAPGKHQAQAMTGSWARDLDTDLEAIKAWGATHLVTLLEPWEPDTLRIPDLPERALSVGLQWHGLPITDRAVPDERFLVPWQSLGPTLRHDIENGARVVVHCMGGLGRAGTVACLLLLDGDAATSADDAMAQVRAVRPGAIETTAQEAFLRSLGRS